MTDRSAIASSRDRATPRATYRLQLHAGFGFDAAAEVVPYLAQLGVSHVYTSPILRAATGSMHGYDVVDHTHINPELGGVAGFDRLAAAVRSAGMGLVVDVVPNHMAIGEENPWWWDVLRHGPASRYATYFDIDWDPPERAPRGVVILPVLADAYAQELAVGTIRLERRGTAIAVAAGGQRFPLACGVIDEVLPGGATDAAIEAINADRDRLHLLLEAQHYRLADWRAANRDLRHRRFFDVDTLVGLRVEDPAVYEASHRVILDLVAEGAIAGLRVDHPDGLRDPAAYFERLRRDAPDAWIVAEKILSGDEELRDWPIDGTTGYRFANQATGLLVDADGEPGLTEAYRRTTTAETDWSVVASQSRSAALANLLGGDVERLAERLVQLGRSQSEAAELHPDALRAALREVVTAFEVYRTYVRSAETIDERDRRVIDEAVSTAARRRPDLGHEPFDFVRSVLLLEIPGEGAVDVAMRFQQLTPAAMAKGVEDTAFYRYLRLLALNEVGGDPGRFGLAPAAFHAEMAAAHARWPRGMLTISTHDTKRSADVRARLALLSEVPQDWEAAVARLARAAMPHRRSAELPGPAAEYLFFQTVVGAWPIDAGRASAYMLKALREAKEHTSWSRPDRAYEEAVTELVELSLGDPAFVREAEAFVAPMVAAGRANALAQTLFLLTAPGVPDIYQGNELWDRSLVDPDNRRPVDYDLRRDLLREEAELPVAEVLRRADDGLPKLRLVRRALALRVRHPTDLGPSGRYRPLAATGPASRHVVAYLRGERVLTVAPRLPLRLLAGGGWRGTTLPVAGGRWRNVLTGAEMDGSVLELADLLDPFPVALLERME